MREKFVYPVKEKVYGWYPPAKSMYTNPRTSDTYMQECLYKHWKSRYNQDNRGVETPQPPTPVKSELSPRLVSKSASTERATTAYSLDRTASQTRPQSTKSFTRCKTGPPGEFRPKLLAKAWATKVPETEISTAPATLSSAPLLVRSAASGVQYQLVDSSRLDRIKSATIQRDRVSPPKRTVKSAASTRTLISLTIPGGYPELPRETGRSKSSISPDREDDLYIKDEDDSDSVDDYGERVRKYGWRMEVHGDPLRLKRFRKRLPNTVECEEPKIPPNPPTGKMEGFDTFFYNTIPRKPLSYTVHPEWMSEVLHAKRVDLQKREGVNYQFKSFGFAY